MHCLVILSELVVVLIITFTRGQLSCKGLVKTLDLMVIDFPLHSALLL